MTTAAPARSFLDAARDEPVEEGQGTSFLDAARDVERGASLLRAAGIGAGAPEPRPEPRPPSPLDQRIVPGEPTLGERITRGWKPPERGPTYTDRARAIIKGRAGRQKEKERLDAIDEALRQQFLAGKISFKESFGKERAEDYMVQPKPSWSARAGRTLGAVVDPKTEPPAPDPEKWGDMGKITAPEMWGRTDMPFLFDPREWASKGQHYAAVERLRRAKGKMYFEREKDLKLVEDRLLIGYEMQVRGTTLPADAVPGVKALLAWMGEFLATGGLASVGRIAAAKVAGKVLGKYAATRAGAVLVKGVGWFGSGAMRTIAMPHRVGAEYFDQLLPDMELSPEGKVIVLQAGAKPATAFFNAIANTLIETMSEEAGATLARGLGRGVRALPGGTKLANIARKLRARAPKGAMERFARAGFTKAGYSNFIGEMGEEQLARVMRAVTGTGKEQRGIPFFERMARSIPGGRELLVEGIVLAVPGAVRAGVGRAAGALEPRPPTIPTEQQMPRGVVGEARPTVAPATELAPGVARPITGLAPTAEPSPIIAEGTFLEAAKAEAPKPEPTPEAVPAVAAVEPTPEAKVVPEPKVEVVPEKPPAEEPAVEPKPAERKRLISEDSYKEAIKRLGEPKLRGGLVPFSGQDIKDAATVILYHVESGLRKMGEIWEQAKGHMDRQLFRQAWRASAAGRARFVEIEKAAQLAERKAKRVAGRKPAVRAVAEARMEPAERQKLTATIKAGIRQFKAGQKELSEVQSAMTTLVQRALPVSKHGTFARQIVAADTPNKLNLLSGRILNAIRKEQIEAGAEYQAIEAVSEEVITTPSKLLAYAMKKAQTVSRQAHLAGARELAQSHAEVAKLAEAALPRYEQAKVLPMLAQARTRAELRRVAMSITLLAEHHDRRTALREFEDTKKGIGKLIRKGLVRPEYQAKIAPLLDSINSKKRTQHTLDRAERLMKMLEVEPDPNVPHNVIARARNLSESERRTPLWKLPPATIRGITAALRQIVHLSNVKNRMLYGRRAKTAQELIDQSITEVETNNPKVRTKVMAEERRMNWVLWTATRAQLSVDTTAYELGGDQGAIHSTLVANPLEGNDLFLELQASAAEALAKTFAQLGMTAKDLQQWSASAGRAGLLKRAGRAALRREGVVYVKTNLPRAMMAGARLTEIELTRAQRVTLWCHLHDSDTRRELLRHSVEGIWLPGYHVRAIKLHPEDIAALEESFTPQERAIGQAMMNWLNGPCREAINAAFMSNEGHEIARRTDYFPRRRYGDEESPEPDKILAYWRDNMLNQQGIFKPREGSKKAIVVGDAFEVFYAHANRCAAYVGKHAAVLDALRLLNNRDFRWAVNSRFRYGGQILHDLDKAIKEYRGLEVQPDVKFERGMRAITGRAHIGILGYSPHISLYQVVSYMYAGIEMDTRDLAKAWNFRLPTKALIAEISAHSPALKARFRGTGHQILTPSATRYSLSEFYFGKEPGWRSKAMVTIRKMDQLAIANIYQAAKSEGTRRGLSSEALLKYAAKRAEVVVNRTQPTWDLISTSALSVEARKSLLARLATLFSSQRAKIVNMAYRSWVRFRRSPKGLGDYARFAKTLSLIGMGASAVYWIGTASWRLYLGKPDERNKRTITDHLWGMAQRLVGSWVVVGDAASEAMRLSRQRIKGRPYIFMEPRQNLLVQGFSDAMMSMVEFSGAIAERCRDEDAKSEKSAMRAIDRLIRALTILAGVPIRVAWAAARARLKKKGTSLVTRRARRTRRSGR